MCFSRYMGHTHTRIYTITHTRIYTITLTHINTCVQTSKKNIYLTLL